MEDIRVGVIGVGFMGRQHAAMYKMTDGVDLCGVADVVPETVAKAAADLETHAYRDTADLLADPAIQAVSICTNDERHVDPTLAAMKAGKHILLEKPIASTVADADRIIDAAKDCRTCLLVGHTLRFERRYVETARLTAAGEIGDIASIYAKRIGSATTQDALRGRVSVLSFLGVHDFDICSWIADSPAVRVFAEARTGMLAARGYDVEDQVFTTIRFDNGVIACVESGWILPKTHPRGAEFRLDVVGTEGSISLDLTSAGMAVVGKDRFRLPQLFGHGLEYEIRHFLQCVRGQETARVTPMDARQALEISLAAQQSAESNSPVTLPLV